MRVGREVIRWKKSNGANNRDLKAGDEKEELMKKKLRTSTRGSHECMNSNTKYRSKTKGKR